MRNKTKNYILKAAVTSILVLFFGTCINPASTHITIINQDTGDDPDNLKLDRSWEMSVESTTVAAGTIGHIVGISGTWEEPISGFAFAMYYEEEKGIEIDPWSFTTDALVGTVAEGSMIYVGGPGYNGSRAFISGGVVYSLTSTIPAGSGTLIYIKFNISAHALNGDSILELTQDVMGGCTYTLESGGEVNADLTSGFMTIFGGNDAPNQPSNPNPSHQEIDIDVEADLSWTGGDPNADTVTYDIYFDTVSPPQKAVSNQSDTVYDPGTMAYETLHYWQIVAWDQWGAVSSGPIWEFTTVKNFPPEITNEDPQNGSLDVPVETDTLSITITDPEDENIDWTIETSPDVGSASGIGESSGVKTCSISNLAYETTYTWFVNATDISSGETSSEWYTFTTLENFPPEFSDEDPQNGTLDVPVETDTLSVTIDDPEDDNFDWTIETNPNVGSSSGSGESNGVKTCSVSGLAYETTYMWYVNATDIGSGETSSEWYTFTTVENFPPEFSDEDPQDGATQVPISTDTLSITITDPEGDNFDWTIETNPNVGSNSGSDESGGIKTCSISGLDYYTTYNWYVNSTDIGSSDTTSDSYIFTTEGQPPDPPTDPDPTNGEIDISINPTLSVLVIDQDGHNMDVSFYNASGDILIDTDTNVASGNRASINWLDLDYDKTYEWYAIASDNDGQTQSATWSFTTIQNQPPEQPTMPSGTTSGASNREYTYTSTAHDPELQNVAFWFDWGDGNNSGWTTYVPSDTQGSASHSWENAGNYQVKVKAKDTYNVESIWSDELTVSIVNEQFIRGDATGEGDVLMNDVVFILKYLYVPDAPEPPCLDAADANDDGEVLMNDCVFILQFLYVPGAPEPPAPGPYECGPDLTSDSLSCDCHPFCMSC